MEENKLPYMNQYQKKRKRKRDRKKHRKTKKIENKRKKAEKVNKERLEKEQQRQIEEEPTLIETALNRHLTSYQINVNGGGYKSFLENKKKIVLDLINKQKKPIKTRLILECKFYKKGGGNEKIITIYAGFSTKYIEIFEATDVNEEYNIAVEKIIEDIEKFVKLGSGWIFESVESFNVHINKYNTIAAKSYIDLPKELKNKKAIINLKNKDNQCFKWAVTRAIYLEDKNNERISSKLKDAAENLNWDGLEFPVELNKIYIFEKNNPKYRINVLGYETGLEVYKKKKELCIIRISKKPIKDNQTISLLLIAEDENRHYCLIKKISRLLNSQVSKNEHTRFYCERCLLSSPTQKSLDKHLEICKNHEAVKVTLPVGDAARLTFMNSKRKMRVPFVIYADCECALKNIQTCEQNNLKSFTHQYQKHEPSGFSYMIKCCDDSLFPPKMVKITGENIPQRFVESIEEEVRMLYNEFDKKIKNVKMSRNERNVYKNATHCHICEKEFIEGDDDKKVLDHDHLTGAFRGAAHISCNLNYKIPNHIPIFFHNLGGYDAHLFIKMLGLTPGRIECIERNIFLSLNTLKLMNLLLKKRVK